MWYVFGVLFFIGILVTGFTMPDSFPSAQIPLAGLGMICFIMGTITRGKNTDKQ